MTTVPSESRDSYDTSGDPSFDTSGDHCLDTSSDPFAEAERGLARIAALDPSDPARAGLRAHVICLCLPMARREAARYRHTGEPMEDLVQVATLGLIQAVDRFDGNRGVPFRHFALPTISGELKRHFRDRCWSVRVGRRVQELHQAIQQAEPELAQRLKRTPTVSDVAAYLGVSEDEVVAGLNGGAAYSARSLNWLPPAEEDAVELGDALGAEDRDLEAVTDRESLRVALRALPERLRLLLMLRFVDELTQTQIADKLGISQMHVSRLISRALSMLRRTMLDEQPQQPTKSPAAA